MREDNKTSMPVDLHVEASYAGRIIKVLNSGLAGAGSLSVKNLRYCLKLSVNNALVQLTPHCRPAPFHCRQDPYLRCCPKYLLDTLYIYLFGKHGTTSRYGESVGLLFFSQQERLDHRRRIRLGITYCSRMCKASVRERVPQTITMALTNPVVLTSPLPISRRPKVEHTNKS